MYGTGQVKELTELVPGILNQLGPDSLASLRKLAESYQAIQQNQQRPPNAAAADDDDDDVGGAPVAADPQASPSAYATSASVASLTHAVRELGLNIPPNAAVNAGARVDTSDPTYAALLKQWCFAQSSPPAPAPGSAGSTPVAAAASPSVGPAVVRSGDTTPKVGFGQHAGYGFPGFSFGLPDAGMVGGE